MPRIAQIQVSFAPTEDRLLLRLNTDDRSELRFWLTRRYVKLLTPILTDMVLKTGRAAMIPETQARETVSEFEREEALASADFKTRFNDTAQHLPLGEAPVILARIQTKQPPNSTPILCMHPQEGQGIELNMDSKLLHSFRQLLTDGIKSADWDLASEMPQAPDQDSSADRLLN